MMKKAIFTSLLAMALVAMTWTPTASAEPDSGNCTYNVGGTCGPYGDCTFNIAGYCNGSCYINVLGSCYRNASCPVNVYASCQALSKIFSGDFQ